MPFVNVNWKFFCSISMSFEFQKFRSQNTKAMAKDKRVNIAVTYTGKPSQVQSLSLLLQLLCRKFVRVNQPLMMSSSSAAGTIKLFTAVIDSYQNKLECLSLTFIATLV